MEEQEKLNQEMSNEEIIDQVLNAESTQDDPASQDGVGENKISEEEPSQEEATSDDAPTEKSEEVEEKSEDELELPIPDLEEDEKEVKKQRKDWYEIRQKEKELKIKREAEERDLEKQKEEFVKSKTDMVASQFAQHVPDRDDFADEKEYTEAMVNYTLIKRDVTHRAERIAREQIAAQEKLNKEVEETKSKGATKYSNFHEVVEPLFERDNGVPPNIALVEAINESKFGADILYMLGKNKKKAIEVASMSSTKAARWVFDTEKRFEEVRAKSKVTPQGSAKPMQKVQSKLSPSVDISNMTPKQYKEWWRKKQYGN